MLAMTKMAEQEKQQSQWILKYTISALISDSVKSPWQFENGQDTQDGRNPEAVYHVDNSIPRLK